MMPLRVAKKIFNNVCREETLVRDHIRSLTDDSPFSPEYQKRIHEIAIRICGYTPVQIERSLERLHRTLRNQVRKKFGGRVSANLMWGRYPETRTVVAWF